MGRYCGILEWKIENFGCWNYKIHGNMVSYTGIDTSPTSEDEKRLELFPKGLSGEEENLVMRFSDQWFCGEYEISFIGSDGSLIKMESICLKDTFSYTGPMFKTVIAIIRKNKAFHKDELTIRFRSKSSFPLLNFKRFVHTIIDVYKTSLKLNSDIFKDSRIKTATWEYISDIQYPLDEGKKGLLDFYAFKTGANVFFKLKSFDANTEEVQAQICITYLNGDESIVKYEETEYIFTRNQNEWIRMESMSMKELLNKTSFIHLSLKIVSGNVPKTYSYFSCHADETEISLTDNKKVPGEKISQNPSAVVLPRTNTSVDVLTKELMCLFQDQDFCDFQLRCGQFTFAVHKGILSARSPVFKIMLTSDMSEAVSGSVDIEDLDGPTLARFLAFLYSGKVDDVQWESAIKLYYAADKYQVPTLKGECVSVLRDEISVSNVCEILSLADKHQDDQLTSVAHDFILKNYDDVLKSDEWMDFMAVDPTLLVKTLTLFSQKGFVKSSQ